MEAALTPTIVVDINAGKPRKGAFCVKIIRNERESVTVVELLDMPRPFLELKALDIDKLTKDVIAAL